MPECRVRGKRRRGLSLKGGRLDGFVQKAARHGKLRCDAKQSVLLAVFSDMVKIYTVKIRQC